LAKTVLFQTLKLFPQLTFLLIRGAFVLRLTERKIDASGGGWRWRDGFLVMGLEPRLTRPDAWARLGITSSRRRGAELALDRKPQPH
jgi:hypothetical protein